MSEQQSIDGVNYRNTHSGQKKAYGDSFYEYEVESDLPAAEVEAICAAKICSAIPKSEWLADYRKTGGCTMEEAFRPHYEFKNRGDGKYFYSVCSLYTD